MMGWGGCRGMRGRINGGGWMDGWVGKMGFDCGGEKAGGGGSLM